MAVDLLDTARDGIPGSFAAMAGGYLGESGASTGSALAALLPVLMASVARNGAAAGGTRGVLAMLANPSVDTAILPNLNSVFAAGGAQVNSMLGAGAALASSIFGERLAPLTTALGSMSGFTKPASAQKLVALAVIIVLAFLKRVVAANALSADELASLLASQRPFLEGALDSGLTGALGYADPAAMVSSLPLAMDHRHEAARNVAAGAASQSTESKRAARSGFAQWGPWLAGAIVVLYVLSRLMTLHDAPGAPAPAAGPSSISAPTPSSVPARTPSATEAAPGPATEVAPAAAPPTSGKDRTGAATDAGAAKSR